MYCDTSGYKKNEALCGKDGETRVRHYTNSKGLKGIQESGVIYAQDNNRVYLELAKKKPLSSIEGRSCLPTQARKRKKLC